MPARLNEVLADGRLLDAVGLLEFPHHFAIAPGRETPHDFMPHRIFHQGGSLQHFVAAERNFSMAHIPHFAYAWSLQWNLLAAHHAVATLRSPACVFT